MSAIALIESIGLLACVGGVFFTIKSKAALSGDGRLVLSVMFLTVALAHGLDVIEWSGGKFADQSGDIIKVLIPAVWLFFIFVVRRDGLLSTVDRQNQQLAFFFESSPVAVAVVDKDCRYLACSNTWLRLHNQTVVPLGQRLEEGQGPFFKAYVEAAVGCMKSEARLSGSEFTRDGDAGLFVEYKAQPFKLRHHVAGCILAVEDVSRRAREQQEREEAQRRLFSLQHLDTVGQIATGVAHDVNNLLQVIQAHAQALNDEAPHSAEDEYRESLESIRDAVGAASGMTRWLLSFSRKKRTHYVEVDLAQILRRLSQLLRRALPRHQDLVLDIPTDPIFIMGDSTLLEQLAINLVLNARDAMPEGGSIRVGLSSDDSEVHLRVEDEGSGIEEAIRQRILEPFFTTKGDQGTGMGLAVVQRAVSAHGARLELSTEPGRGSRFSVHFPVPARFDPEKTDSNRPISGLQRVS